jgi:ligand-binding sensor domain-containing protein
MMRTIFFLPLILSVSLGAQITPAQLQASVDAGIDPYFIESKDTISKSGPWHITRDILQDKKGNMWFATWLGIIEYDGKVFTNHTLKDGLIHFHVFSIYENKKGDLWFGTVRGGLYRYDGKTFKLFATKDGLPDNSIECMMEDKEGNMWFATDKGLSCYDGKSFRNFTKDNGLSGDHIHSLVLDKKGILWIGSNEGLDCYDGKTFSAFKNEKGETVKKVTGLFEDRSGKIWIGTFDGIMVYNGKTVTNYLSNYLTNYFVEDKKGNMFFTHGEPNIFNSSMANQVLYKYDGKEFSKIIEKYEGNDFQIFGKAIDKNGDLWFGTMHGPCCYNGKTFKYFTK